MKQDKQTLLTGASLAALTFFLTAQTADAGQCYTMPTCETMGYTETTCVDKTAIKCPFDTSKMKCVVIANPTSSCPEGYTKNTAGECVNAVDIHYASTPVVGGIKFGNLIFSRDADKVMSHEEAESYCSNLGTPNTSEQKIWRLPTQDELVNIPIVSVAQMRAIGNLVSFPIFEHASYWSSTKSGNMFCSRTFSMSFKYDRECWMPSNASRAVVCVTTTQF